MALTFDVVSIGCLSHNRFWGEQGPLRSAHATTTLIRDGDQTILVDPSLPAEALVHRLSERTGLKPDQVNRVFLTSFQPVHRRGLALFDQAEWLMHGPEIEAFREHLLGVLQSQGESEPEQAGLVREELSLLERIRPAPDKLSSRVDLFPAPGVTPGSCCLLLVPATMTVAIAGDVVVNRDYLEHGRAYERCHDAERAAESLAEIIEIADQIVCGHDNLVVCRGRSM